MQGKPEGKGVDIHVDTNDKSLPLQNEFHFDSLLGREPPFFLQLTHNAIVTSCKVPVLTKDILFEFLKFEHF